MPEKSEGNNNTSKMNVSPVSHTIFFLRGGQKMDLFAPHGAAKYCEEKSLRKYL